MKDNVNDGGTHYLDKDGNDLTEQEYTKLLKKAQTAGADTKPTPDTKDKEVKTDER